jgi:hypothetical protein
MCWFAKLHDIHVYMPCIVIKFAHSELDLEARMRTMQACNTGQKGVASFCHANPERFHKLVDSDARILTALGVPKICIKAIFHTHTQNIQCHTPTSLGMHGRNKQLATTCRGVLVDDIDKSLLDTSFLHKLSNLGCHIPHRNSCHVCTEKDFMFSY